MFSKCSWIVELSHEEIKWNPERVANTKLFINKCKWKGINHALKIDD